jgi:hypothetical protein
MHMALKTVPLEIDGIEFQTTQFPAMRALEVMVSLQKIAAGSNQNAQLAAAMMASLDQASMKKLVLDLLECTVALVKSPQAKLIALNKPEGIDQVFSGKLRMLFTVIQHAVEVNYGDFNDGEETAPQAPTPGQ